MDKNIYIHIPPLFLTSSFGSTLVGEDKKTNDTGTANDDNANDGLSSICLKTQISLTTPHGSPYCNPIFYMKAIGKWLF